MIPPATGQSQVSAAYGILFPPTLLSGTDLRGAPPEGRITYVALAEVIFDSRMLIGTTL